MRNTANDVHNKAYWRMNNITAKDVVKLDVMKKVQTVLGLLREIDGISMNIVITIKKD